MSLNIFILYLIIGGTELIILYKKEGKSKPVFIYFGIYSLAMVIGFLTMLNLLKRNFSYIMDFL